ncbi:UDP-glucuronic acid decarboxylase family protein [Actinocrispum wychmicini]|uniref:dTDP-glucose 4,6-dehydratase n=1 Tax=Actinocrispum wychmicini TaxID=1213861 RepID=A0A4R2JP36_9PSEU|nr:UDP-glucuronic acid decarboxylase family protein [Actinocrispum wychmicini]TCO61144.1 dTDP-glucose 4,6-dehydratase [Actinocrispum wychmicini]
MPKTVVVTGGAGFLGSHICERLLAQGIHVWCVDNFLTGSPHNVDHLVDDPAFHLMRHDVSEPLDIARPHLDAVLHFASPASPADYLRCPIQTLQAGSRGTFQALELARHTQARFVLASTSEVYGDPHVHPQKETYWGNVNPIGPRSVYDEAKRFAEAATTAYRRTYGTDCGIVRIFNTFGPRMHPNDGRAIPTFIAQAVTGQPITVTGDGTQTRSICYVDDLVSGVLSYMRSTIATPVNLGNPHELTILELARRIRHLADSTSPITFIPLPEDDPRRRRPDITRAKVALGWQPDTPIDEALNRTISWFRQRSTTTASPIFTPQAQGHPIR